MTSDQRQTLLVLGGFSDIGLATARAFARHGFDIILAARNSDRLVPFIADFSLRYNIILTPLEIDITATENHEHFADNLAQLPDVILCTTGTMSDQKVAEGDYSLARNMIDVNYSGPVSILEQFAKRFEARKSGRIIGISSIAGMRGRASNYLYGSTKAAFTAYLEGLQHRLKKSGVRVDIIKPGFVRTRMTEDLDLPQSLLVSPEALANVIYSAKANRREIFPNFKWMMIAQIIRHLPNFLFLKSKL